MSEESFERNQSEPNPNDDLRDRLDRLEDENTQLREQLRNVGQMMGVTVTNPNFNLQAYRKFIIKTMILWAIPIDLLIFGGVFAVMLFVSSQGGINSFTPPTIGPVPIIDVAGIGTTHEGIGVGIIALGGLAFGVVAMGGGAVGVIAVGGGAVGLFALGGGSIGFIAVGGGSIGYIAVGGGAFGRYALGGKVGGKAGLGLNRQDDEAVLFFVRFMPGLKKVFTRLPEPPAETDSKNPYRMHDHL
jgi:hypothetical protein